MVMYQGALLAVFFAVLLFPFFGPLKQRLTVFGVTRDIDSIINIHGDGFRVIPDTVQCEDLHLHEESGLLFTACQGSEDPTARLGLSFGLSKRQIPRADKHIRLVSTIAKIRPRQRQSRLLTCRGPEGDCNQKNAQASCSRPTPRHSPLRN